VAPIENQFGKIKRRAKAASASNADDTSTMTAPLGRSVAAAWMAREENRETQHSHAMIQFVLDHLPRTETYARLEKALGIPLEASPQTAAAALGNGSQVIASDTVLFCLWYAARHSNHCAEALWAAVSVLGDRDTICAIVGGIVALSPNCQRIPPDWTAAREPINVL
jgi:ADP-ribosylglycohydrolase